MGHDQGVKSRSAKRLNALEQQLRAQQEIKDKAQAKYDALYRQVWMVFDQELGEGAPARFVCADGYVLGRQVRRQAPTVDAPKLIELVGKLLPGLKGKRLLSRAVRYEPVVDQRQLAEEIRLGRLSAEAVQGIVTTRPDVLAKYPLREASAQQRQALEAGILASPDESEEWAG